MKVGLYSLSCLASAIRHDSSFQPVENMEKYVIVFDAGSSGTRATAYKFEKTPLGWAHVPMGKPMSFSSEVNLAKDDIDNVRDSFSELTASSKEGICGNAECGTNVVVLIDGTGGMRDITTSDQHLRMDLAKSIVGRAFPVVETAVIDGDTEARYMSRAIKELVGGVPVVIDLGGASIQAVRTSDSQGGSWQGGGMNMFYYSHITPEVMHYCINDFHECSLLVMQGIMKDSHSSNDISDWFRLMAKLFLRDYRTYLVSGFMYTAMDIGLMKRGDNMVYHTVREIRAAAENACRVGSEASKFTGRPRCFDGVYIYHLLTQVFGYRMDDTVTFMAAGEDGSPASWSLGAAIDRLG